jgi:hypothetical protein
VSIPGFSTTIAEVFIAETGADMSMFPTAGHLASWAGTSPGSNESAGRVKSTKTRPGNRYLKGALGIAALSCARSKNTYLGARYRRIASRRGPAKALVAVEHSILTAAWHMLTTGELYNDPGADYFTRQAPAKTKSPRRTTTRIPRLPSHPRTPTTGRITPITPRPPPCSPNFHVRERLGRGLVLRRGPPACCSCGRTGPGPRRCGRRR